MSHVHCNLHSQLSRWFEVLLILYRYLGIKFDIESTSLAFIINHLFLPPKLPQQADSDVAGNNSALLKVCVHVAESYQHEIESLDGSGSKKSSEMKDKWEPVARMLRNFASLENYNSLDADAFKQMVLAMKTDGELWNNWLYQSRAVSMFLDVHGIWSPNWLKYIDVLALHVGAQNAGLILHQRQQHMVFQSFEASPLAAEVLKPVGKLRCSYPGPAIEVSLNKVKDNTFLSELASFLEKINRDTTLAQSTHSRGSNTVAEERDTTHPKFVTELLTGILRGIGQPATVQHFEKRLGDEVLWSGAEGDRKSVV